MAATALNLRTSYAEFQYLDIKSLYLYSCQTFASHLKGKSPDAIREMLGIENDLTPEEEAEIRQKNVWVNY